MADGASFVDEVLSRRRAFRVVEPSVPLVDQDGNRVLIRGRWLKTFMSETNATRLAAALQVVADLAPEFLPEPTTHGPEAA